MQANLIYSPGSDNILQKQKKPAVSAGDLTGSHKLLVFVLQLVQLVVEAFLS